MTWFHKTQIAGTVLSLKASQISYDGINQQLFSKNRQILSQAKIFIT
jgi:hypothetical protein